MHATVAMLGQCVILLPYPRERGPMGGAPYIGPKLGDGPIFEVSASRLYSKERPGKLLVSQATPFNLREKEGLVTSRTSSCTRSKILERPIRLQLFSVTI